jgi:hypothetical protein
MDLNGWRLFGTTYCLISQSLWGRRNRRKRAGSGVQSHSARGCCCSESNYRLLQLWFTSRAQKFRPCPPPPTNRIVGLVTTAQRLFGRLSRRHRLCGCRSIRILQERWQHLQLLPREDSEVDHLRSKDHLPRFSSLIAKFACRTEFRLCATRQTEIMDLVWRNGFAIDKQRATTPSSAKQRELTFQGTDCSHS